MFRPVERCLYDAEDTRVNICEQTGRMKQFFQSFLRQGTYFLMALAAAAVPATAVFAPSAPEAIRRVWQLPPDEAVVRQVLLNPWQVQPMPAALIDSETLWLARLMYSESKRAHEQELVAWVVRNRSETGYRGCHTIEAVARDPYQFSALIEGKSSRHHYTGLDTQSHAPGWQRALALAYYVRHADASLRPFPLDTRHFFSEQSLAVPTRLPEWTKEGKTITPARPVMLEPRRFRFYAGVS